MTSETEQGVERLCSSLAAVGGRGQRADTGFEMAAAIERIMRSAGDQRSLLYEPFAAADRLGLPLALRARGIELVEVSASHGRTAGLRVALTGVELAIAESGCLLIGGRPGGWGLASVLPWVHVAVVDAADIRPTLAEVFPEFLARFDSGARDWVWVTGPSKTADIAKTLVTGIHGPNGLEVLVHSAGSAAGER